MMQQDRIANNEDNRKVSQPAVGSEMDWSTVVRLARRVLDTASLAVMAHGEAEGLARTNDQGEEL